MFVIKNVCNVSFFSLKVPSSAACLFVDWLELIDPEVISLAPDLQLLLLFAKQHKSLQQSADQCPDVEKADPNEEEDSKPTTDKPRQQQAYLLALLTHQSHWGTLHRCINRLLQNNQHTL